jgi:hypothetical protein
MPIINWVYALEGEGRKEEQEIKKMAKDKMDEASNLRISVNGKCIALNLSIFRVGPVISDVLLPNDNIFDMVPRVTSVVADGYWVLFQPLGKDLTIETYGSCQSGIIQIRSNYRIIICNS